MDRRQYVLSLTAVLGAGCLANDERTDPRPEESSDDGTPAQSPPESSTDTPGEADTPPDEWNSPTDSELWGYEFSDRSAEVAVTDAVSVATNTTLTRLSPTGDIQWRVGPDSDSYAVAEVYDLAVAGSMVCYTARASVGTGEVGAYEAASGEQRWTTTLDEVPDSVIAVTEDSVFASQSHHEPGEAPVFAFDAETGEERWRTVTGMDMGSTVSHGLCLVYSVVDGLTALDTTSGDVQWERPLPKGPGGTMEVVDDVLCLYMVGAIRGYSLPDGTHLWTQTLSGGAAFVFHPPSEPSNAADLYFVDESTTLTALDTTTGDTQWEVETEWGTEGDEGLCVGNDSLIYHSGTALASYDPVDGTQQWTTSVGSGYEARRPFIVDGTVFLVHLPKEGGQSVPSVQTFDAETGNRKRRIQLPTPNPFAPQVVGVFDEYAVLRTEDRLVGVPVT